MGLMSVHLSDIYVLHSKVSRAVMASIVGNHTVARHERLKDNRQNCNDLRNTSQTGTKGVILS